ncbi:type II toxin-antitoxin system HicA family toxin [Campylobacter jejuni]
MQPKSIILFFYGYILFFRRHNVRFETLKILLESEGYECFNKGGSHYQFRKEECDLITIPFKRPIKAIYVKMVLKAITGE